ncbi:hypothetical protein BDY21DRAFT_333807 [Lineolata rhizophorae]|uniref:Uncharacterized protein n=1 Tax=Lineolata rhizophorae TaxID=578093 RepID=A0A6A6PAM5_9PEZI|nr:hypothetical protein BDY21DRAFT_333807 [Lineolata rhizophorae]
MLPARLASTEARPCGRAGIGPVGPHFWIAQFARARQLFCRYTFVVDSRHVRRPARSADRGASRTLSLAGLHLMPTLASHACCGSNGTTCTKVSMHCGPPRNGMYGGSRHAHGTGLRQVMACRASERADRTYVERRCGFPSGPGQEDRRRGKDTPFSTIRDTSLRSAFRRPKEEGSKTRSTWHLRPTGGDPGPACIVLDVEHGC